MALKDRLRRAIRTDRSSSTSSSTPSSNSNPNSRTPTAINTPHISGTTTPTPHPQPTDPSSAPNPPTITLTKTNTSSKLGLTKSLTWTRNKASKQEKMAEKQRLRLEFWEQKDRDEWSTPEDGWKRSGNKKRSKQHQDLLRAFEWKFVGSPRGSFEGRRSVVSGISPGQSRVGSLCDGVGPGMGTRKRNSGIGGVSALSREVSKGDDDGEGMDPFGGFDQNRPVSDVAE